MLVVAAVWWAAPPALADGDRGAPTPSAGRPRQVDPVPGAGVAAAVVPSVGLVRSAGGFGSGWVVGEGSVVTNFHVAKGGSGDIYVEWSDGELVECWTAVAHREKDLAVLKCDTGDRPPLRLARAVPTAGTEVVVVGYPRGEGPTTTTGVLTGERPIIRGVTSIGFTAGIQPGSSGSPVVDDRVRVVGVATWGGGHGVPAEDLEPLVATARRVPVDKARAEWGLRLRRSAVVAPVVAALSWFVARRRGRDRPGRVAARWTVGATVVVLALTQAQFALDGPTSFI